MDRIASAGRGRTVPLEYVVPPVVTPPSGIADFPLVSAGQDEADSLIAVIRRLAAARTLAEVMEIVTHAARIMLAADGITFVLRQGERCYYAEEDSISPLWRGRRFPLSACISGWCMEHDRSVSIPDITVDERIPQDAYRPTFVKSLAMVPVRHEVPIAALGAYWARPHAATSAELELLQTIANSAALAISYVQLREQQFGLKGLSRLLNRLVDGTVLTSAGDYAGPRPAVPSDTGPVRRILIGVALTVAALAIRMLLAPLLESQVPYVTFYLAVVLGTIWGGLIGGTTATILGGVVATWAFVLHRGAVLPGAPAWFGFLMFTLTAGALLLLTNQLVRTSEREKELNRKLQLVGGELQHRIKNFMAVAQSIALQTGRSSSTFDDFQVRFQARLQALGRAQSLLARSTHSSAGLALLIERTLAPFGVSDRVRTAGVGEIRVTEDVAVGLALVFHELATNALKYGALSSPDGRVEIECEKRQDGRACLIWREAGGPKVENPSQTGFGTRLVRSAIPRSLGRAEIEYGEDGVICTAEFECSA